MTREEMREYKRRYYQEHKELHRDYMRLYRKNFRDEHGYSYDKHLKERNNDKQREDEKSNRAD